MRERRILPRWELRAGVSLESDDNLYAGISCDVSAGGIFVATHAPPPVGSDVKVHVTMPASLSPMKQGRSGPNSRSAGRSSSTAQLRRSG